MSGLKGHELQTCANSGKRLKRRELNHFWRNGIESHRPIIISQKKPHRNAAQFNILKND